MIRSMTGYSRVRSEGADFSLSVSARTTNHRFLDLQVRLPAALEPLEPLLRRLVKDPVAYRYEHEDGVKCTMLLMNDLVRDFNFAARLEGRTEPFSTQMYLPMPDGRTTLANFFSPLVNNMEKMYLSGKPTYPVERTLLTTGLTAAGVESLYRKQARYDTPHLAIRYQPTKESTFWRT